MKREEEIIMKKILGWLFIISGIAIGIYIGIWFLLIGGIMQIVNGLTPVNAFEIAIGVVRIMFTGTGWIPIYLGIVTGMLILEEAD